MRLLNRIMIEPVSSANEALEQAKLIRGEYEHLKQLLGRIPGLLEFGENEPIDPLIIFKKHGSYAAFPEKHEPECKHALSSSNISLARACSGVSPASTLPPGNSRQPSHSPQPLWVARTAFPLTMTAPTPSMLFMPAVSFA